MHQPVPDQPAIRFYKLKTNEDIVAFELESTELYYRIRRPLAFSVENEVMGGRQMLNVREWLPPIVCGTDEVFLPKEYVLFATEVRESFKDEFTHAVEFLYNVSPRKRSSRSREDIPMMLKDPSTKPN
jgi:hypothetical protein